MMTPPAPQVAYVDGSALIPMALGEQPVGDAVPTAIHLAAKRSRGTPPMNMPQVKSSKSFIWAAIFATAFLVALATTGCQNHTHTLDSRILGAVVAIGCEGEDGNVRRVGTGVAVLHGGKEYLATALHIVEQCDVQLNIGIGEGRAPEWTTVGTDQEADIAVLTTDSIEITQDHPPYADQQPPHGTLGYAIGFPSAIGVTFVENPTARKALPIAVPVVTNVTSADGTHYAGGYLNHGFSGGAIATQQGNGAWQVVGIITHKLYAYQYFSYEDPETGETKFDSRARDHAGLTGFTEVKKVIEIIERYGSDVSH